MTSGPATDELSLLFIDDEQAVLDGIARALRRKHPRWKARFVSSPVEALLIYKQEGEGIDVVVCDINMPQVSGLQVMRAIRERSPRIGIIALSGQLDVGTLLGVDKFADCRLCKPVNTDILCEKILKVHSDKRLP